MVDDLLEFEKQRQRPGICEGKDLCGVYAAWKTAWKVWSGFIVLFIIAFLANLLVVTDDPSKTLFARLMQWLFLLGSWQIAILSILGLLVIATFTAGIITALEYRSVSSSVLRAYLRRIIVFGDWMKCCSWL